MRSPSAPNPPLPPALIFALFFAAGALLGALVPIPFVPPEFKNIPALLLTLGGVFIALMALRALRKARTTVNPYRVSDTLLTTGPYMRTRNPIYLAFAWIYLGLAAWIASLWPVLLFPILILVVNRFVIAREEAHLEARFGKAWRDYKSRVRRWM